MHEHFAVLQRARGLYGAFMGQDERLTPIFPEDRTKGLWTHTTVGFCHDGRFAMLEEVIGHYGAVFGKWRAASGTIKCERQLDYPVKIAEKRDRPPPNA